MLKRGSEAQKNGGETQFHEFYITSVYGQTIRFTRNKIYFIGKSFFLC